MLSEALVGTVTLTSGQTGVVTAEARNGNLPPD